MKILTTNFLTCAVKACKSSPSSYPLHFRDASLERISIDFQPDFILNILPRIDWEALKITASELGLAALVPESNPTDILEEDDSSSHPAPEAMDMETEADPNGDGQSERQVIDEQILRNLHSLLLETCVMEGKLICANCDFQYPIKEGVGNFLLPAHLV